MKGIILAAGKGTRLYPASLPISKILLSIYDKPMIYYPLCTLIQSGIKDILIITNESDIDNYKKVLGNGHQWGIQLTYRIQPIQRGIADAFIIAKDWINQEPIILILGDNLFYGDKVPVLIKKAMQRQKGATVFGYAVKDPEHFGVVTFDHQGNAINLEEKPIHPQSNTAVTGLYIYDNTVCDKATQIRPSKRGELEITDLNNLYLKEARLNAIPMKRGNVWLDAGTPTALMEATQYIGLIEQRQGLKIACIEELVYKRGLINDEQMQTLINTMKPGSTYRTYLEKVYGEAHENN